MRRRCSVRIFVNVHSNAMPQRVPELLAIASRCNDISCSRIQCFSCNASTSRLQSSCLCLPNNFIDALHLFSRLSNADRSGHIAVIAVHHCTKIHQHKVPCLYGCIRWHTMRHGSSCTRQSNSRKRHCFCSQFQHREI